MPNMSPLWFAGRALILGMLWIGIVRADDSPRPGSQQSFRERMEARIIEFEKTGHTEIANQLREYLERMAAQQQPDQLERMILSRAAWPTWTQQPQVLASNSEQGARIRHVRAAAENLQAAGMTAQADELRQQAAHLEHEARSTQMHGEVLELVRSMNMEIRALHLELSSLRSEIRSLKEVLLRMPPPAMNPAPSPARPRRPGAEPRLESSPLRSTIPHTDGNQSKTEPAPDPSPPN